MAARREALADRGHAWGADASPIVEAQVASGLPHLLPPLLRRLDGAEVHAPQSWRGWRITPIAGGANNLLYRATGDAGDYAVKFTLRDDRDRAGREFAALRALQQAGLDIAPQPVWLDRQRYRQPVVVQTWLAGEALAGPPQTDAEWTALLEHYVTVHSLTPPRTTVALVNGYVNVSSGEAGKALVSSHARLLPPAARPATLHRVLAWIEAWTPPTWPAPPRTLVRVDSNWRNFIRRGDALASVDWEYSGWGDPAFELAELTLHPAYQDVPSARWDRLVQDYAGRGQDATLTLRVETYRIIMLAWWLVRWARYRYETPRGMDARLVSRPPGWLEEVEQQYARYLAWAEQRL